MPGFFLNFENSQKWESAAGATGRNTDSPPLMSTEDFIPKSLIRPYRFRWGDKVSRGRKPYKRKNGASNPRRE